MNSLSINLEKYTKLDGEQIRIFKKKHKKIICYTQMISILMDSF